MFDLQERPPGTKFILATPHPRFSRSILQSLLWKQGFAYDRASPRRQSRRQSLLFARSPHIGQFACPGGFGELRWEVSCHSDAPARDFGTQRASLSWHPDKRHEAVGVSSMHRVVITGIGVVSPNGIGRRAFEHAIAEGRSGVGPITAFDTSGLSVKIAGEVKGFDVTPYLGDHKKNLKVMSRAVCFAVGAAAMAVEDAGVETDRIDPSRLGVCMGTGIIPMDLSELAGPMSKGIGTDGTLDWERFAAAQAESMFPLWLLKHLPNMAAAHISILHHAMGPNNTIVTACAAGTQAVGEAFRLIARGDADIMLAGGCDSRLDPLMIVAYQSMNAVSRSSRPPAEVSRPFDGERDGFVLGEGAAVLVMESLKNARRRGARIFAEVIGYGSSFDAYGITRPEPTGKGAALAIQGALREARIDPKDIDYINAHGTSTKLNDIMETNAVKRVFGERALSIPISSQKSMVGHLIGASGALEAAATAITLERGVVPPTINQATPDPDCDLDYVPNMARSIPVRMALSNSFGFGGQNASLVLSRLRPSRLGRSSVRRPHIMAMA
jgi:3-oxoacyl-[acyl-carrier-protein] synthase II